MDLIDYYYSNNVSKAIATPTPNNGNYKLYSIAYPMLAKTVSSAGVQSPTGNSTNLINISSTDIEYAEGFPTLSGLVSSINAAISAALLTGIKLISFNNNQVAWENTTASPITINYVNAETKCLITGSASGSLTQTVPVTTSPPNISTSFSPDPTLGLSSLEFRIANGDRISIPANGDYLGNYLFYLNTPVDIRLANSNNCFLIANYASLRITKELASPRISLIRLAVESK
jgi:hypothetical protein